jgi:hypothetical protein
MGTIRGSGFAADERSLVHEAAEAYVAYLGEAYGLTEEEVGIPEAYRDRPIDWFGQLNEVLHLLDGYEPDEVAATLRRRDPRLGDGETVLSLLRDGKFRRAHAVLRRM